MLKKTGHTKKYPLSRPMGKEMGGESILSCKAEANENSSVEKATLLNLL